LCAGLEVTVPIWPGAENVFYVDLLRRHLAEMSDIYSVVQGALCALSRVLSPEKIIRTQSHSDIIAN